MGLRVPPLTPASTYAHHLAFDRPVATYVPSVGLTLSVGCIWLVQGLGALGQGSRPGVSWLVKTGLR